MSLVMVSIASSPNNEQMYQGLVTIWDWRPWSIEIRDLFLIADLAERYTLPGLSKETIDYAKVYTFPKERLIPIFCLAEDYHVFAELSQAVMERCAEFLMAILETADDLNNFLKE